jgi:Mn-containing catalase
MFVHNKRLQYTVRVAAPNPGLANLVLEQFGGPQANWLQRVVISLRR